MTAVQVADVNWPRIEAIYTFSAPPKIISSTKSIRLNTEQDMLGVGSNYGN